MTFRTLCNAGTNFLVVVAHATEPFVSEPGTWKFNLRFLASSKFWRPFQSTLFLNCKRNPGLVASVCVKWVIICVKKHAFDAARRDGLKRVCFTAEAVMTSPHAKWKDAFRLFASHFTPTCSQVDPNRKFASASC